MLLQITGNDQITSKPRIQNGVSWPNKSVPNQQLCTDISYQERKDFFVSGNQESVRTQ